MLGVWLYKCALCTRYSTIETKEAVRIGYNGFHFQHEYSGEGRGVYNNDVIIYKIKKSWEQFCLWTSLPNFPITAMVKFLSSFIKRTTKTSACNIGLYRRSLIDIRSRIYNKGNNKITELRTILQRESQNS